MGFFYSKNGKIFPVFFIAILLTRRDEMKKNVDTSMDKELIFPKTKRQKKKTRNKKLMFSLTFLIVISVFSVMEFTTNEALARDVQSSYIKNEDGSKGIDQHISESKLRRMNIENNIVVFDTKAVKRYQQLNKRWTHLRSLSKSINNLFDGESYFSDGTKNKKIQSYNNELLQFLNSKSFFISYKNKLDKIHGWIIATQDAQKYLNAVYKKKDDPSTITINQKVNIPVYFAMIKNKKIMNYWSPKVKELKQIIQKNDKDTTEMERQKNEDKLNDLKSKKLNDDSYTPIKLNINKTSLIDKDANEAFKQQSASSTFAVFFNPNRSTLAAFNYANNSYSRYKDSKFKAQSFDIGNGSYKITAVLNSIKPSTAIISDPANSGFGNAINLDENSYKDYFQNTGFDSLKNKNTQPNSSDSVFWPSNNNAISQLIVLKDSSNDKLYFVASTDSKLPDSILLEQNDLNGLIALQIPEQSDFIVQRR